MGLLLKPLGFTLQKPTRRSYRQNPKRVAPWREETLPELTTTAVPDPRVIFYVDESAFYLLPQVRQTWAPAGQTPILSEGCQSAHLEVISAINEPGDIYYQLRETSYTGSEVAKFIRDLGGLTQQKLLLIWDGASIHRRQEVKDLLGEEDFAGRVQLALLPAYSPQLNAASPVWAWLKGGQLKPVCCKTLDELTRQVQQAFAKQTENTEIIPPGFEHPEVSFY